jgi:predicted Zn-ribbon and HTH transcriptional regulator
MKIEQIKEILVAYWKYLFKKKNKELQKERLEICKDCKFNSTPNKIKWYSQCLHCGCFLKPKSNIIFKYKNGCPVKKW